MKQQEKELFFLLCDSEMKHPQRLKQLLKEQYATPDMLGALFYNRMAGIAYYVLSQQNALSLVHREFRQSLAAAYTYNCKKNQSYQKGVQLVEQLLSGCQKEYALLKGAYLCSLYPPGCRTASDIDLLTENRNVSKIAKALTVGGFQQGHMENGTFIPATRQEIIASKMLRGETVPFIKSLSDPYLPYLEVDINFSLDYKNGNAKIVNRLIQKADQMDTLHGTITTLSSADFFIHLCQHLYKEATTYPWIAMQRDMTLYKFYDILYLLRRMTRQTIRNIVRQCKTCCLIPGVQYAIAASQSLWKEETPAGQLLLALLGKPDATLLNRVIDPAGGQIFHYTEPSFEKRFWHKNRKALLEVIR